MHLEAVIKRVLRCTSRPWSSEFRDTLGGRNQACLGICTWRPWLCELGGCDCTTIEVNLEAVIESVWKCTWRPWSSKIGGVHVGGQFAGGSLEGRHDKSWDSIHLFTHNCGNVKSSVQHGLLRDERQAGSKRQSMLGWCSTRCMQYSVYAVLGVCSTRCMQYSVYAVLGVWSTQCMQYSVYAVLGVCSTQCIQYSGYAVLSICCTRCMLYSVYAVLGVCCTRC
jgi:hypothetical protein